MTKPTRRLLALSGVAVPISVALVAAHNDLWVVAVAYLGTVFLLTVLDSRASSDSAVEDVRFSPPAHLCVGQPQPLRVEIVGRRECIGLEALLEVGPTLAGFPSMRGRLKTPMEVQVEMPLLASRRGEAELIALWLRWTGPLGLIWQVKRVPIGLRVPVIPDLAPVRRAALALKRFGTPPGVKPQSLQGDGSEFDALRTYQPGLNIRSIDWKQSAKHRELVCKEYKTERNHLIVLAVDSGRLMREPLDGKPKLDHAIDACLLLAFQALAQGDRVGVLAFDSMVRGYRAPVSGGRSFHELQLALARIDYSPEETNFTLGLTDLAMRLRRRALVVVITDFVDTITAQLMIENLQRLSARHLIIFAALRDPKLSEVVFMEPRSLESMARSAAVAEIVNERRRVLERLTAMGVSAADVEPQQLDSTLIARYLHIKQRELI